MLAEIAAANAAIAVIRTALKNGKDVLDCGTQVRNFVNAKADLEKKASKKRNSVFASGTLDGFLELEKIKKQENELREMMQLYGRAGMYDDWLKYQAQCRRERLAAIEARRKRNKQIFEIVMIVLLICVGLTGLAALFWWALLLKSM